MKWRPNNWDSKSAVRKLPPLIEEKATGYTSFMQIIYEAGADAILEELRKSGVHMVKTKQIRPEKGVFVFIPDKK